MTKFSLLAQQICLSFVYIFWIPRLEMTHQGSKMKSLKNSLPITTCFPFDWMRISWVYVWPSLRWGSSWSPRIHLGPLANLLSSWYQDTCCDANLGRDALPTPFIGALGNVHTPCLVWSLLLQHQASLSSCSTLLSPAPGYPAHDLTSPGMLLSPSLPYCLDFLQSSAQCLLSRESCFSRTGKLPLKEACAARWSSFFPALLTGPHQLRSESLIITSNSSSIPSVFPFFLYSSLSLSLCPQMVVCPVTSI